jgi:DNA-binding NtrC family response regulator
VAVWGKVDLLGGGNRMEHRHSVLVVEDDPSWQMNYEEILEEEGYLVELAANKEEAAHKLRERTFDVAIVDLRLVDDDPRNRDGAEVVKLMHDLKVPTRAIVKSGYLTEALREQLEELGTFGILDKESPPQELTELVARAVRAG